MGDVLRCELTECLFHDVTLFDTLFDVVQGELSQGRDVVLNETLLERSPEERRDQKPCPQVDTLILGMVGG